MTTEPTPPPDDLTPDEASMDLTAAAKLPVEFLKKFLDLLQDKVANPENYPIGKITLGELNFLQRHRPELFAKIEEPKPTQTPDESDIICDTQEALAARMVRHYINPDGSNQIGMDIDKGVVSDWCKLKRLDSGNHEPPGTISGKKRGKYSLKAWIEWFDKYMLPEKKQGGHRGAVANRNSRQRKEDADARIAEAEADRIEKENSDKWTLTTTAEKDGSGLGIVARNATRDVLENQLVPKVSLGLDAFIPDEAVRLAFLVKLRRDAVELVESFQNGYSARAREILNQAAIPTEK